MTNNSNIESNEQIELGFFSDREYPFGTVLFLVTIPLNLLYLLGSFIVDPITIIPLEFFIFNFTITVCGLFLVFGGNEWNDGCF